MRLIKITIIISIIILAVFGFSNFLEPIKKADAIVCSNCSHWWKDVVQFGKEAKQWAKEWAYPALRDAAIKRVMDQIADDTVKWIEGGGEPRFVSDWNGFLEDNFSAAVGDVILQTKAAPLCSPFKVQVSFMLLPKRTLSERARCTIEDIGLNLQNFYDDFLSGGWLGYSESWAPQNNYFMTAMMVYDEALIAGQKAQTAKAKEAEAGKGFLGVKKCRQTLGETDGFRDCVANSGDEAFCENDVYKQPKDTCVKEETITPGDAVGEAFKGVVKSDSQWAASAQSAIAVIADALINRVVKEGVDYVAGYEQRQQEREAEQQEQENIDKINYQQQIQPFIVSINKLKGEWNYIKGIKQQSYDIINGTNGISLTLNEMQTRNCQPPHSATAVEINDAQVLLVSLSNTLTDLSNKNTEADKMIDDLNNAADGTDRQRMIAQQNYIDFDNRYNTEEVQIQIEDGIVRQAASSELTELQSKLTDARNRLQLCIQAQTPQF